MSYLATKTEEIFNVKDYGAVGDGVADDIAAINAAIADASGGGEVFFPAGVYLVSGTMTISASDIKLRGEGEDRSILKKSESLEFIQVGSFSLRNTAQTNTLDASAAAGDITLTLSAGKGANIVAGSTIVLLSDATAVGGSGVTNKGAEFVHVFSIATDVLTLSAPLKFAHTTGNTAEVQNISWIDDFEVSRLGFDGNNFIVGGGVNDDNVMEIIWCRRPVIKEVRAWELPNVFIGLQGCLNARVENVSGFDFLSDGIQGETGKFGYAVVELDLNEGLIATGLNFDRVRHGYTTATLGLGYGIPMGSRISHSIVRNGRGSGFDTHPEGLDIGFHDCAMLGSLAMGFQIRSLRTTVSNCHARDCVAAGLSVSADGDETLIDAFSSQRTNSGTWNSIDWTTKRAINDDGTATLVDGILTKRANQTVNNSITLVDVTDLSVPISQYERLFFTALIKYSTGTTPDIKFTFIGPSGSSVEWGGTGGAIWTSGGVWTADGPTGGGSSKGFFGSGGSRWVSLSGFIITAATAGQLTLQFAQNVADESNTIIVENSHIQIWRR